MATPIDDELSQIGAALVAAADGEPVELTAEQREVLARASVPDTLDAILAHVAVTGSGVARIAEAWSGALRAAFLSPSIADKIAEDNSPQAIRSIVSRDGRLSIEEKELLLSTLPDPGEHSTGSGSTSSQLPSRSRPRAYLASISVEGFRGIGQRANLPCEPRPGLTLIYGANGSGKSTFAEALDVLLTGSTARFAGRGHEWRSAWANAHNPDQGRINVEFLVEDQDAQRDTLTRNWTAADLSAATGEKDNPLWEPVKTIGGLDVAGAIDEFRPILGYGELGPLFDESGSFDDPGSGYVTPFAQHIRARASIRDGMTDTLWKFVRHHSDDSDDSSFGEVLSAWDRILRVALLDPRIRERERRNGYHTPSEKEVGALQSVIGDVTVETTLRSPSDWNWERVVPEILVSRMLSPESALAVAQVARGYLPRFSDPIRAALVRSFMQAHNSGLKWYLSDWDPQKRNEEAHGEGRRFRAFTPRVNSYAEMLLDEIHDARLEQFSQRASGFWRKIRHGSSDVHFEALSLRRRHRQRSRSAPALRVSLGLTIDGDRPIERGALSQGELHSLALSVFLPTLMRPESPFGFAVIDDPTQGMDDNAIRGFAKVLRTAAKDLQVVVLTHDGRVLDALRSLDIKHTQINIRRSGQSVVECEVVRDEVLQALEDARLEAEESEGEDETARWRNVGFFCRLAVERACIRAVERRMRRQGRGQGEIDDRLRRAVYSQRATTRKLMSLAIWETTTKWQDLADHLWDKPKWGPHIEQAIYYLNGLNHRDPDKTQAAREEYNDDLYRLIATTRDAVEAVEKNCG